MNYKQFTKQQEINFSKMFLFNEEEGSETTSESTEETPVEEKEVTPENKETHESSPTTNTATEEGVLQNNNTGSNQTTKPSNPSNTWGFGSLSSILGTAWENRGKAPKRATGPRPAPHYITMESVANWMGNVPAKGSPQDINPRNHPQKSNTDTPSSPAQNTQTQEPVASEESQTQVTVDSNRTLQKNNSKATLFDKGFWSKGSLPGWIIDGWSKFVGKAESTPKTHEAPTDRITSEQSATSTPTSTTSTPATTEVPATTAATAAPTLGKTQEKAGSPQEENTSQKTPFYYGSSTPEISKDSKVAFFKGTRFDPKDFRFVTERIGDGEVQVFLDSSTVNGSSDRLEAIKSAYTQLYSGRAVRDENGNVWKLDAKGQIKQVVTRVDPPKQTKAKGDQTVVAYGSVPSDFKTPAGSIGSPTTATGTTGSTHIAPNGEIPKPQGTPSKTDPFSFLRDERNDGFFTSRKNEPFADYVQRISSYLPSHDELSSMGIDSNEFYRSLYEVGPEYIVPPLPEGEPGNVGVESSPTEGSGSKPVVAPGAVTSGSPTTTGSTGTSTPTTRNIVDISERNRKNMEGYIDKISDYFATKNKDVFRRPNETYEQYLKRMGDTINKTAETYHVDPNYLGQHWFNRSAANKMTPEQVQNDPNIPDFLKNAAYENNVRQNYLKDPSVQKEVFDAFQNRNKDEESKNKWDTYVSLMTNVDPQNKDEFERKKKYLEDNMVVRSAEIEGLQKTALYFKDQYEQSRQRIINDSRLSEDQKKAAIQKLENDIGKTEADAIDFAQNTAKNLTKAMLPGKDEDLSAWWGRLDDSQKTGLIAGGGLGLLTFLMMMGKEEKDAMDWILGLGLPVMFVGAGSYLGSASKADPTKFDPNRYKAYKKQHGIQ